MDKETLANHISRLGKRDFEIACRLILHDIFNLIAVNVEGAEEPAQTMGEQTLLYLIQKGIEQKLPIKSQHKKRTLGIKRIKMHQNVYLNYTLIVFILPVGGIKIAHI